MMHLVGSLVRMILAISMFVGLLTLPVDTIAIDDTYRANLPTISLPRETLFIWFSGALLAYLLFVELRLFIAKRLSFKEWVPYPVAAQMLYEELKDREVVSRLVRESDHPKPVEAVMAAWVEDGIHKGFVNVRGCREYSEISEGVPQDSALVDVLLVTLPDGDQSHEVSAKKPETKEYWRGLTVLRSSLKIYLRYLEDDTPNFERQLVAKEQA
jgi:hypothetical protein